MGHRNEVWEDPRFQQMVAGGNLWAAGSTGGDCGVVQSSLVREILLSNLEEPIDLEAAPDGRIFIMDGAHRGDRGLRRLRVA